MSLLDRPTPDPVENRPLTGRRYWRSLDELADTQEFKQFLHREFPEHASEMLSPFSRRTFLNLMAASIGLAGGLMGCRRPEKQIMPYSKAPEDLIPGNPQHYATAMERGGRAVGLVAECYEGRPVKLEGNPDFPANLGGTDGITQATILELYDPDRLQTVRHNGQRSNFEEFWGAMRPHFDRLRRSRGEGLHILTELTSSPSLLAMRDRFLDAFPRARWHVWEAVNDDNRIEGIRRALGRPLQVHHDFEQADVVLALDSDFLNATTGNLAEVRQFSRRRKVADHPEELNRLYAVEAVFTLTGGMAEHRLRLPVDQIESFTQALALELDQRHGLNMDSAIVSAIGARSLPEFDPVWVREVAADLAAHRGRCAIVAGASQPASLHALVAVLNRALAGDCVRYTDLPDAAYGRASQSLQDLVRHLNAGEVSTLLMLGGNPIYDAPADLELGEALARVETSLHLTLYENETSQAAGWVVPRAHVLESWGDLRAADGTIGLIQPLIAPIFDGLTDAEILAELGNFETKRPYDILFEHYQQGRAEEQFTPEWKRMLHDGMVPESAFPLQSGLAVQTQAVAQAVRQSPAPVAHDADHLDLVLLPDPNLYDGRMANNGWLQEIPDPISKLTWDNALLMNQATAKALGLEREQVVEVQVQERSARLPVWILPGMADWTLATHVGYGRTRAGRVGNGVGTNVFPLRTTESLWRIPGVKVRKTGETYELACVQDHWAMEGRDLVREMTPDSDSDEHGGHEPMAEALAGDHPEPIDHVAPQTDDEYVSAERVEHAEEDYHGPPALWEHPHKYDESPQWGMTIDLSACTGCNACMVACQAENNIPVVGKEQVRNGREMHWIRLDRYFVSEEPVEASLSERLASPGVMPDEARMVHQPVPCMQCENAPCEVVCPVVATTHSPDGLNEMTYNRCIGTRYCSNNCPYKVRRFNFFNYHGDDPIFSGLDTQEIDLVSMAANPEVTVRMRGVMEKCTYCVQRLNRTKIEANKGNRRIRDGEVMTACQQACPSEAIQFGDITDPESRVVKEKKQKRNYALLDFHLHTRPRTSYLARWRNPNPKMKA